MALTRPLLGGKLKISKILNKTVNRKVDSKILIYKQLIDLTLYLVNNFKIEGEIIEKDMSNKYRLMKILNFIENNYEKEELNKIMKEKDLGMSVKSKKRL